MPEGRISTRRPGRIVPPAACLALALASWLVPGALGAQARPGVFEGAGPSDTLRLDLGVAVRTAARRSASVELERLSSVEAEARVVDQRAALLPSVSVDASQGQRTFNTASCGLDFPTPPGQDPLFEPAGEVVGPVETVDFRARLAQTLFDWSAFQRLRGARASLSAVRVGE